MTYFGLIWAGLWRTRARTIFTLLSIVVAFMLFGVLQGVDATFNRVVDLGRPDVLLTASPSAIPLPLSALSQIERVPGVTAATYQSGFVGYFQSPSHPVPVFAVDPQHPFLTLLEGSTVPDHELATFRRTRTGALISARLAERLHWKIGDHVPLQARNVPRKDGNTVWTFDIVGIYRNRTNPGQLGLAMQYAYFDAERARDNATVQLYFEQVADPAEATAVANAIDGLFVNSADPTRTDTERGYLRAQLAEIGDLEFFVVAVIAAAFTTLLLMVGSTMMQSFRERIAEFAVMKTIGFSDRMLALLVVSEALLLCIASAAAGLLLVSAVLAGMGPATGGTLPSLSPYRP